MVEIQIYTPLCFRYNILFQVNILLYLPSVGLQQVVLLLLHHEPEHNQNQIQDQSSRVNIEGLERQQMCNLNFNVNIGLYDCPVNRTALAKLAGHARTCLARGS